MKSLGKTPRVKVWCEQPRAFHSWDYGGNEPAKIVRCPTCGKRIRLKTENAEPFGSFFEPIYIYPRHKRRVKSAVRTR